MCNCLFCGQEMEAEENKENPHICPPDENVSLQSVRVAMNKIFDKEDDGWEAWAQLVEWLNKQSAQQSVHADEAYWLCKNCGAHQYKDFDTCGDCNTRRR
jgi:hypothetical protein